MNVVFGGRLALLRLKTSPRVSIPNGWSLIRCVMALGGKRHWLAQRVETTYSKGYALDYSTAETTDERQECRKRENTKKLSFEELQVGQENPGSKGVK